MNEKFFTEYRSSDYRTARSLKELYGWEPPLYVERKDKCLLARIGEWVIDTFGGR